MELGVLEDLEVVDALETVVVVPVSRIGRRTGDPGCSLQAIVAVAIRASHITVKARSAMEIHRLGT